MRSGSGTAPAILPITLPGQAKGWSWRAKSTPSVRALTGTDAAERIDDLGDQRARRDPRRRAGPR